MTERKKGRARRVPRLKQPSARDLVDRLVAAMEASAYIRAEANWTNGYRCAAQKQLREALPEEQRLYAKEMDQWQRSDRADKRFRRVALKVLRAVSSNGTEGR